MKILYLGEIVGKPGRKAVKKILPGLITKYKPDFVFANGENLTHNKGINKKHLDEMLEVGIDYFTSGNHIFDNREFLPELEKKETPVIRPANYPNGTPGRGFARVKKGKKQILLVNLIGRVFMLEGLTSPFFTADEILKNKQASDFVIVDFHAEATSEKLALSYYLENKINLFIGTHTHIPTADEEIRNNGMAYITDIGMIGPKESILGIKKEIIIEKFLNDSSIIHDIALGDMIFNAILVEVEEKTKKAKKIQRIREVILDEKK